MLESVQVIPGNAQLHRALRSVDTDVELRLPMRMLGLCASRETHDHGGEGTLQCSHHSSRYGVIRSPVI